MSPRRGRGLCALVVFVACLLTTLHGAPADAQAPEFRAYWVDAWHPGFKSAAECDQLLADVKTSNCNVIVAQMRRRGDTYYPSNIEPFAEDANPNFDALRYLLDICHAQNPRIEVHAWLVLLPIWNSDTPPTNPNHPYLKYPEYLTKTYSGTTVRTFDPGHPDCEQYLNDVVMELVNNYPDLDGISYDYSRFASTAEGYNDRSVARFNARYNRTGKPSEGDPAWCQWRRDQITNLIRKTYANATAANQNICMSSAVVTWHPSPVDAGGFTGTRPYYQVFQDWQGWMREGILDLSMPMAYFDKRESYAADYDGWMSFAKENQFDRGTVIGPGIYMNSVADSIYQLRQTRDQVNGRAAMGAVMYSYASTNDENNDAAPSSTGDVPNSTFYNALSHPSAYDPNPTPIYNTPVSVPPMTWKTSPTKGHIRGTVYDCNESAWLDGATVSAAGPENRSMTCDGTGFYAFIDLLPGTYTVTASYPNRPSEQSQVVVTAGQVATADFVLCADPTAPVLTNIRAEGIGYYSADIMWNTDDPSTTQIDYGLTTSYGSTTPLDSAMVRDHVVHLSGLTSGRTYHYRVRSKNVSNLESVSDDHTFATTTDTTPPIITNVRVASVWFSEAYISWETDDPSTSQVRYGPTSSYGSSTTQDPTLARTHGVLITGLTPSTTYHFSVRSVNADSLTSDSGDATFTTTAPIEVIVDNLQATFTQTSPDYLWTSGTSSGGWPTTASEYVYVWNNKSGVTATCTWTPNLPVSGPYDVYVWHRAASNQTTAARFTVNHAGGTTSTIYVNQQQNGSQWYKIQSALQFNAGSSGYVKLTNRTSEYSKTRYVVADAVKFVFVGTDSEAPSVPQNVQPTAASTTSMSLTWTTSTDNVGVAGYKVYRNGALVGTALTNSFVDSGLVANTAYSYTVSAFDARENTSGQSTPVSRYTLAMPPTEQSVKCNRASGVWYNTPGFAFSNDGFAPGGVSYYLYAWDTSPTHEWTGAEFTWAAQSMSLNAEPGNEDWYFHVRSCNGDGVPGGSLDKGPYRCDPDPPTMVDVSAKSYIGVRGTAHDDLSASWSGSDAGSGIADYQYAIGTAPGTVDILNWTSAGVDISASYHYSGALLPGSTYFWSVKARDAAGNWSAPMTSDASICANAYDTLAEAAANPDSTPVVVDPAKVLSANLGGFCYVQEPDGTRGIRMEVGCQWEPGDMVRVAGRLATIGGERCLQSVETALVGNGSAPKPVGLRIADLGGASPDGYTEGLAGATGCYNLGLLVRIVGRVTEKGSGYFVVDDGSGATAKVYSAVIVPDEAFVGG
jgi:uncharacterized lipoprotein YddW (UPF0748 family)